MHLDHIIRQAKPYRTRVQFPMLRGRPVWCSHIKDILVSSYKDIDLEVRFQTGSIILLHPESSLNLKVLISLVKSQSKALGNLPSGLMPLSSNVASFGKKNSVSQGHVPEKILAASGIYLAYLILKGFLLPTLPIYPREFLGIPFILTLGLTWPIQKKAVENVKSTGKADMSLISTGLLYLSLFTGNVMSALIVAWIYNLSAWMEARVKNHARRLVRDMFTGKQTKVFVLVDGVEVSMNIDQVQKGDTIVLNQGQAVLADGKILKGRVLVNESAMTGESVPVVKNTDDRLLAGTFVEDGQAHVKVEKIGEDTRMAAIIRLIEAGENDSGQLGRTSLKISQAMVPISLGLGALTLLITGSPLMAMGFMMVTCPCALRLSTSTAVSVAMTNAASSGILIKGGSYVEAAGRINVVVLDKTGTLTNPVPGVTRIDRIDGRYKSDTILGLAASVLKDWNHPLGRAVSKDANKKFIDLPNCSNRKLFVGKGGYAFVNLGASTRKVFAGSLSFMSQNKIDLSRLSEDPQGLKTQKIASGNNSCVYLAIENHLVGCIHVNHTIRNDVSSASFEKLRKLGVSSIVMLTGDTEEGTRKAADLLPFDEVHCSMSPEAKAQWIQDRQFSSTDEVIAMVGDGINDTPAFSKAHLSFAVGDSGEDITLEYADIVLQKGGVNSLVKTLEIGQHALRVIKESYAITIGANSLTLALMISGFVSPVSGALIHNLITGASVLNAAKK